MRNPLPPGVRCWVMPEYAVEVNGRKVALDSLEGQVLMLFLCNPERWWPVPEMAGNVYLDREDGGPANRTMVVRMGLARLINFLARNGILLELLTCGPKSRTLRKFSRIVRISDHRRELQMDIARSAPWHFPERIETSDPRP